MSSVLKRLGLYYACVWGVIAYLWIGLQIENRFHPMANLLWSLIAPR